jgi:hypothetical protein
VDFVAGGEVCVTGARFDAGDVGGWTVFAEETTTQVSPMNAATMTLFIL